MEDESDEDAERMCSVALMGVAVTGLLAMVVLGGNFIRVKDFRNPINHVYVSLFAADSVLILTVIVGQTVRFVTGTLRLPNWACQTEGGLLALAAMVSVASIAHIGRERYNIVVQQFSYDLAAHRVGIVFTWVSVACLATALGVVGGSSQHTGLSICAGDFTSRDNRVVIVAILITVSSIGGSVLLALFSYVCIAKAIFDVRYNRLQTGASRTELTASSINARNERSLKSPIKSTEIHPAVTALTIATSYFVTWATFALGILVPEVTTGTHAGGVDATIVEPVLWMLIFWHCSVWDVVLVSGLDPELRAEIRRVVARWWAGGHSDVGNDHESAQIAQPRTKDMNQASDHRRKLGNEAPDVLRTAAGSYPSV
ncbi:hypothetical protein M427DRAFT_498701 [Gonapodya prolifera JEL478]|uniref:G-protein coupled receptors family 1 profile domain-containing protein n=1 Tax=Gonapodya prolifera (strain JEL478) TaxID=1344416 RepID=A0A139ACF1_GONPJ|nr:hypothetical protein M427DRAFT_498701 [Gonapodya prolifera JEL478]|eukprot:KXS14492.1 hypothetical protein M427DRAFT_498701 [Gonapodya prolifera JEL478]